MKKVFYISSLISALIIFCFFFPSCEKDSSSSGQPHIMLPATTQSGANTFGCMVEGLVWLPNAGDTVPAIRCNFISPSTVMIQANKADVNQSINIILTNAFFAQPYVLNDTLTTQTINYRIGNTVYSCDSLISGKLTLTNLDTIKHIISGRFDFDAVNGAQRIDIRIGRFDLMY